MLLCQFLVLAGNWQCFSCGGKVLLQTEKKDTVVCLEGARSLLRPEKKRYSRLSGGCAIIITTGKKKIQSSVSRSLLQPENKKDTVVCLAGARSCLSFLSRSLYLY